jgi:hypothetical protein
MPVTLDRDEPSGPRTTKQLSRDLTPPFVGMPSDGWLHRRVPLGAVAREQHSLCFARRPPAYPRHQCASVHDVFDARGTPARRQVEPRATTRIDPQGVVVTLAFYK